MRTLPPALKWGMLSILYFGIGFTNKEMLHLLAHQHQHQKQFETIVQTTESVWNKEPHGLKRNILFSGRGAVW